MTGTGSELPVRRLESSEGTFAAGSTRPRTKVGDGAVTDTEYLGGTGAVRLIADVIFFAVFHNTDFQTFQGLTIINDGFQSYVCVDF